MTFLLFTTKLTLGLWLCLGGRRGKCDSDGGSIGGYDGVDPILGDDIKII